MNDTILEVKDLAKGYSQGNSKIEVIKAIQLHVHKGSQIAILGKSGAGKSTLLSLLSGLDIPDHGSVRILGQNLSSLNGSQLARFRSQHIGIVFQQFHLISSLTALENVALALEIKKSPNPFNSAKQALEMVQLEHRAEHFPHQLSGGECQRVAIARAFIGKPALILADEPTGNLDEATSDHVMHSLFELAKQEQTTLVLVTHNPSLANFCHQSYQLHNGSLNLSAAKEQD